MTGTTFDAVGAAGAALLAGAETRFLALGAGLTPAVGFLAVAVDGAKLMRLDSVGGFFAAAAAAAADVVDAAAVVFDAAASVAGRLIGAELPVVAGRAADEAAVTWRTVGLWWKRSVNDIVGSISENAQLTSTNHVPLWRPPFS